MSGQFTREALESQLLCRTKGYLRFQGQPGIKSEYEQLVDRSKLELRRAAREMVLARFRDADDLGGAVVGRPLLTRGPAFILDATIEDDLVSIRVDGLRKVSGPSGLGTFHYVPVLF